ncbi:MAG: four helix bundle protein [Candidatus Sungbacteria bacterium]|uniref:Four helix bundle protein n=1 Tax=Candidatus Sungiibacteriota bacterium TaxID=2750080 RepID=A0A931SBU5_9BACT|nr:four helix bundle protein [Candidatus Sungbacteria bacterium]
MKNFRDLIVWQRSHQLLLGVYSATKLFPKEELYSLTAQLRRAVLPVGSNIAEGFKRNYPKESGRFYNMAAASLEEVKYQLLVAKDLEYLSHIQYQKLEAEADEVGRLLHGWIKSQRMS